MARKRNRQTQTKKVRPEKQSNGSEFSITFGEPEQVLSGNLLDGLGSILHPYNGYYEPPISRSGLSRMRHANAHHGSCLIFRRNMLANFFVENPLIAISDFKAAVLDYLVFGEAYFQIHTNYFREVTRISHLPALNMRRMPDTNDGQEQYLMLDPVGTGKTEFYPGSVIRAAEYDTGQQIYGVPDWLGGLQSALLNEDATLFRRRYYKNGCHIGYILYTTDPSIKPEVEDEIRKKVSSGKGVGNFKSLYMNIPNGKKDSVQVIPVGDISQRDEFERVKNLSAKDVIVAHRVRGELSAVIPEETNSADIEKVSRVYVQNETKPLAQSFMDLNKHFRRVTPFQFDFPALAQVAPE
ncbi:phage portal protein [Endozoicomonas montiporae]|uniref:PBSX family phage portal protein n=1 Tax=Endozoicomonas montiporae CL-33 TaxID=570277 RepID=A0A142BCU2_9GAMM|nr:phage portal protein [Endozoicomonas montiporae]AMO56568.1 PBSX family phage portal protein [Endozoicomonas montiporae CL-33]